MKYIVTSLVMLFSISLYAQSYFEVLSFQAALKKAKKKDRLLMVRIESKECIQCNIVAEEGLKGPGVEEVAEKYVIAVSYNSESPDWKVLTRTHFTGFGLLFFDEKGNMLHKYTASSTSGETYITEIKKAVAKQSVFKEHEVLDERFKKGERNPSLVKELIQKKMELGIFHDGTVTIYLDLLTAVELYSAENVAFLIGTAPLLTSRADSIMRKDTAVFNSCWQKIPLQERIRINQSIITKTRNLAVSSKNRSLAQRVASFTSGTYLPDKTAGTKAWYKQMIYYSSGVKDTFNLLSYTQAYANAFLFPLTKDSLEKKDSIELAGKFKSTQPNPTPGMRSFRTVKSINTYANDIDEIAQMYVRHFKDSAKINFALKLMDKAIELFDSPSYFETKASLFLIINKKEDAIAALEQALASLKQKGLGAKGVQQKLDALTQNASLITE